MSRDNIGRRYYPARSPYARPTRWEGLALIMSALAIGFALAACFGGAAG